MYAFLNTPTWISSPFPMELDIVVGNKPIEELGPLPPIDHGLPSHERVGAVVR
jgi:hypothetical protein